MGERVSVCERTGTADTLIRCCGVVVREAVRKASVFWRNTSGVFWSRGSSGVFREQ